MKRTSTSRAMSSAIPSTFQTSSQSALLLTSRWMDFPREGNGNSFAHARRQFNLVDDQLLRYRYLNDFDVAMNWLEDKYQWLKAPQVSSRRRREGQADAQAYVSLKHEGDKVIVYERAGLLFIFNCMFITATSTSHTLTVAVNPTQSFTDYRVGVDVPGEYGVVLSSDEKRFGGHERVDLNGKYFTTALEWNNRKNWLQVRRSPSPRDHRVDFRCIPHLVPSSSLRVNHERRSSILCTRQQTTSDTSVALTQGTQKSMHQRMAYLQNAAKPGLIRASALSLRGAPFALPIQSPLLPALTNIMPAATTALVSCSVFSSKRVTSTSPGILSSAPCSAACNHVLTFRPWLEGKRHAHQIVGSKMHFTSVANTGNDEDCQKEFMHSIQLSIQTSRSRSSGGRELTCPPMRVRPIKRLFMFHADQTYPISHCGSVNPLKANGEGKYYRQMPLDKRYADKCPHPASLSASQLGTQSVCNLSNLQFKHFRPEQ